MKICIVATNLHPIPLESWGGIEVQVQEQARGLAGLGHDVHVLTVGKAEEPETTTTDGVAYHSLKQADIYRDSGRAFATGIIEFALRARKACRRLDPDIVHYHTFYPCYVGLVPKPRWRAATIYQAHNWKRAERVLLRPLSRRWASSAVGAFAQKRIMRRCDRIVTISEAVKQRVVETVGVDERKITVVYNVIDTKTFSPDPTVERTTDLLYVGRIAREKGTDVLIRAMAEVVRARPKLTLTIVGPDTAGIEGGGYAGMCMGLIKELDLVERVRLEGEAPNHTLAAAYRRARVLVVPSRYDALGLVAIEGLACGTPVVASRVGGLPELIEDGRTGRLVPSDDPAALAAAILRSVDDPALARDAATGGPERVASHHTWQAIAPRLQHLYEELDAARRAG